MKAKSSIFSKDFPSKLKQLRKNYEWSQGELAAKLNTDTRTISQYERGIVSPVTEMILKIAKVFNTSVDYLLGNELNEKQKNFKNRDLLKKFAEIDQLSIEEQKIILDILDAYIKRNKFEQRNKS